MKIDFWTIWGFAAQGCFFTRFVLQWYQSEKKGEIIVPHIFWVISILGSLMLFVYSIARSDIVFLTSSILQLGLFTRNLKLSKSPNKNKQHNHN